MDHFEALREALHLLVTGDSATWRIAWLSLRVSLLALLIATPFAVALGYVLAVTHFPGRRALIVILQSLLSFPTVVVGLLLYLMLSRRGVLGGWEMLFTPAAMILGQAIIAFPILAAFTLAAVQSAHHQVRETAISLGAGRVRAATTLLYEMRYAVLAGVCNGFGRVISEVGCALMVGGNILDYTRTITTAIALETSKGEFAQGIALGFVLMVFALGVNFLLAAIQGRGRLA